MKNLFLILTLFLITLVSFSQEPIMVSPEKWSCMVDTSAFDGITRVAFIIGTSDDPDISSPVLSLNKTNDKSIRVCLSYFPSGICKNTMLYVKFNSDTIVHKLGVKYDFNERMYTVIFSSSFTLNQFIDNLKTHKKLYTRLSSSCFIVDVDFILENVNESLEIF